MRLHVAFGAAVVAIGIASAAAAQPADDDAVARRILEAARGNDRVVEILATLTDRIGPRLSGSDGAARAVEWTARRMRADGLANVRLQPVLVPRWVRGEERATLLAPTWLAMAVTALGGSVATAPEGLEADVLVVESFDELEARAGEAKGRIVYFHNPMDPALPPFEAYRKAVVYRARGAIEAARHGAVAALVRSLATRSLRSPHTGGMRYAEDVPRIPAGALSTEDGDLLHRLARAGERPRLRLVLTPREEPDVESANVIGELAGREIPEEIVLIGAHLDSWDLGTGAFDDGAGCAVVMEAPRLLAELGLVPRRTIRVVLFMNEENGLRGALEYARLDNEAVRRHVAAIESDAGADRPVGFTVSEGGAVLERIASWAARLAPIGADRVVQAGFGGADIAPLGRRGVLTLGLRQDPTRYFDFHHSAADTFDKVDPDALRENLAAMAFLAWALAEHGRPGPAPAPSVP